MYGSIDNYFRIIGSVYGKPKEKLSRTGVRWLHMVLVTDDAITGRPAFIPCIVNGTLREKAEYICRMGNIVAITGGIATQEYFDKKEWKQIVKVNFIVYDMQLIQKNESEKDLEKELDRVIATFEPDAYTPPQERIVTTVYDGNGKIKIRADGNSNKNEKSI